MYFHRIDILSNVKYNIVSYKLNLWNPYKKYKLTPSNFIAVDYRAYQFSEMLRTFQTA